MNITNIIDLEKIKGYRKGPPIGFPYQGSKKKLSRQLFQLIRLENKGKFDFYDVFGGGIAMTAEALIFRYHTICNIYDVRMRKIVDYIFSGKYNMFDALIPMQQFYVIRDKSVEDLTPLECLQLLVNSFGNNFKTYLYAEEDSDTKYKLAVDILNKYGTSNNYKQSIKYKQQLQQLERLQQLEQLQQLQRLQ